MSCVEGSSGLYRNSTVRRFEFLVVALTLGTAPRVNDAKADPAVAASEAVAIAPVAVPTAATAPAGTSVETAEWLEKIYAGRQPPEAVRALIGVARGTKSGPGKGWFGPPQTRYDWAWLAGLHGVSASEGVAAETFRGKPGWFTRLDRNNDGRIVAADLDWSDGNPYVQLSSFVGRVFRTMSADGNSRLTRDEMMAFFEKVSLGKAFATADDLRDVLLAGVANADDLRDPLLSGTAVSFRPGEAPTPELMVRGLFSGETGCINEGPALGDPAPDFSLKTHDGKQTIRLSDLRGSKPIVLVFGNFTCGPFRNSFPLVDELCQRYQDDAIFLAIYVREAHPSTGWVMQSDRDAGVEFAQPRTFNERVAVAEACHAALNHSMPLLVDEINDPVGQAYSGMPSRLYVIDTRGTVTFKNGRGPYGFKPGELEQALIMCLLEREAAAASPPAETTGK